MAGDHGRESRCFRLEIQLRQIMQHVDGNPAEFNHVSLRQLARPRALIDIATHRDHGRNRSKLFEDFRRADIAGMNDVFGSVQSCNRLRPQQPVRVRDDADQDGRHRIFGFGSSVHTGRANATARCKLRTFSSST